MEDLPSSEKKQALKCVAGNKATIGPKLYCQRTFLAVVPIWVEQMGQTPTECSISHIDGCLATRMLPPRACGREPILSKAKAHQNKEYFDSTLTIVHEAPGGYTCLLRIQPPPL